MAYELSAAIAASDVLSKIAIGPRWTRAIQLDDAWALLPMTEELHDHLAEMTDDDPPIDILSRRLSPGVRQFLAALSESGSVLYVEADYFGGIGEQYAIGWQDGQLRFGPVLHAEAINEGLQWLGVPASDKHDRFDSLGLGKFRSTPEWLA